MCLEDQKRTEH